MTAAETDSLSAAVKAEAASAAQASKANANNPVKPNKQKGDAMMKE